MSQGIPVSVTGQHNNNMDDNTLQPAIMEEEELVEDDLIENQIDKIPFEYVKDAVCSHWKTVMAAVALLLAGIGLMIGAIIDFARGGEISRALAFFFIGILCFVPGGYQSFVIYSVIRRRKNFTFDSIPSYD